MESTDHVRTGSGSLRTVRGVQGAGRCANAGRPAQDPRGWYAGAVGAATLGNEDPPAPGTIVKITNGHPYRVGQAKP